MAADGMDDARTIVMLPPGRVLAAVDFSEGSRLALACAARLARHCDGELHVVHVPPRLLPTPAFEPGTAITAGINADLRAFVNAVPCAAPLHPRCHVVIGETARVIRDIARRERCDVIVVGAHGASAGDVHPLGPTTERLLHDCDVPVLVVPIEWVPAESEGGDMTGMGPIIAGLDFTCPSIDAASASARLAARLHTRLLLVHVVRRAQIHSRWSDDVESLAQQEASCAKARLEPLVAALRRIAPVDVRIEIGDIVPTLVHAVENLPGALIVLGRAVHAQAYGIPGAIASRVLAQTHVPLLLATPST